MSLQEGNAAAREVSEARFVVGGGWREKERAGEEKSGKTATKTPNGLYLRLR